MIYILLLMSLFEKWSIKYHFSFSFSYDLLVTLCLMSLLIIYTFLSSSSIKYRLFILSIVLLTFFCFFLSNGDTYLFAINNLIFLGNISIFYYSFRMRNIIDLLLFLKINYLYIFVCFVLYLISKYIYINDDVLEFINHGNGYKYPFYSSGKFTLTFSEPSFAGTYLVSLFLATLTLIKKNITFIITSFIFIFLVYLSGSKIAFLIQITLTLLYSIYILSNRKLSLLNLLLSFIPIVTISSFIVSIYSIHPSFIELLPEASRDSFYTRFFFIFHRFSYIYDRPFGFVFNMNDPVLVESIKTFTNISITKNYSLELIGFIDKPLYFVPKDYFSFLSFNYGLISILIFVLFQMSLVYLTKKLNVCFNSQLIILGILLFISFSNNLTSISILMLLPLFLKSTVDNNVK